MSDKAHRNLQKQHDNMMNSIIRMGGRSLEQALKDTFFRRRLINDNMYKYYVSMEDNPIADFMIAKLDRERALIDLEEYQAMIAKTHEVVKKEAMAAAEEGVNEVIKELNKSFK